MGKFEEREIAIFPDILKIPIYFCQKELNRDCHIKLVDNSQLCIISLAFAKSLFKIVSSTMLF